MQVGLRAARPSGRPSIPPTRDGSVVDNELLWLSGLEQAELIRSRQVSSRELVDATLERIDALDATLGAFISVNADQARREASAADARPTDRPLHGACPSA